MSDVANDLVVHAEWNGFTVWCERRLSGRMKSTSVTKNVTCKKCLKALKRANHG